MYVSEPEFLVNEIIIFRLRRKGEPKNGCYGQVFELYET